VSGAPVWVLGGADAIVEVGFVPVVVPLPAPVEGDEGLEDDEPVAGEGETMDAFDVEPEADAELALEADADVVEDDDCF
jgi:hypothetical protein